MSTSETASGLERIASWKDDYVWYVSYGSNMLRERFLCYIKGDPMKEAPTVIHARTPLTSGGGQNQLKYHLTCTSETSAPGE